MPEANKKISWVPNNKLKEDRFPNDYRLKDIQFKMRTYIWGIK